MRKRTRRKDSGMSFGKPPSTSGGREFDRLSGNQPLRSKSESRAFPFQSLSDVYKQIPPHLPIIPFELFDEERSTYDVSKREDFDILQERIGDYIDKIEGLLDNSFRGEGNSKLFAFSKLDQKGITQEEIDDPPRILLMKTLQKSSKIVKEIDRSLKISRIKKKMMKRR